MFVSNTSTLVLLAKISVLQRFLELHGKVAIPQQVCDESSARKTFDWLLIAKEIEKKNVVVCDVEEKKTVHFMDQFHIDLGEAAAFALFDQTKHKAILTDDKELIKLCRIESVPFICAMAIVVQMFKKKELQKNEALEKLEKLVSIGRYSVDIYNHFVREVN